MSLNLKILKKLLRNTLVLLVIFDPGDVFFELVVLNENGECVHSIFKTIWYPNVLDDWLTANEKAIRFEEFPWPLNHSSISEAIKSFYDRVDEPSDKEFDDLFNYRTRHGFRLAMRGCRLPDVYVGKVDEHHEVSFTENGEIRSYQIDVDSLFENTEARI